MKAILQYLKSWTVGRESGSTLELGLTEKSYKEENWDSRIRKDFLNKKDFQHKLCVAWGVQKEAAFLDLERRWFRAVLLKLRVKDPFGFPHQCFTDLYFYSILSSMRQVHWLHSWMSQLRKIVVRVSKHLFFISVLISLWTTDNRFSDRHQAVSQSEQHCGRSVTSLFWSQSHCGSETPLAIKEWSAKS